MHGWGIVLTAPLSSLSQEGLNTARLFCLSCGKEMWITPSQAMYPSLSAKTNLLRISLRRSVIACLACARGRGERRGGEEREGEEREVGEGRLIQSVGLGVR